MARVALIAFYNAKALGVRYLEAALQRKGHQTSVIYYKNFNSVNPELTTECELELLVGRLKLDSPDLIALSVMSSMYIETVYSVIDALKNAFEVPLVAGGAFATMFPEKMLDAGIDYVLRADGEISVCELTEHLEKGKDPSEIPSLAFRKSGATVINGIGNIADCIDEYGIPVISSAHACLIDKDTLTEGDPQLSTMSYEVIASRGCPFTCSYCCCENLRRLMPKGTKPVRTRSVKSVIEELTEAKKHLRRLVYIHFYDEIFPNLPGWVDEFCREYKKHINLPFAIWSHPKAVSPEVLRKLVKVGLVEVIMGIQSGSPHIRRDIFHRYETNGDIISAVSTVHASGVRYASYDFMLRHPFESDADIEESFRLVQKMCPPYELQLHGLNFLPGTDIVQMAIDAGIYTEEDLDAVMYAPMKEQFGAYWERESDELGQLWYRLIYIYQFAKMRKYADKYSAAPAKYAEQINAMYSKSHKLAKRQYYRKKLGIVFKSAIMRLNKCEKVK